MLKYKNNLTLSKGGLDIGLKVGILAEIGYMLHKCALLIHLYTLLYFRQMDIGDCRVAFATEKFYIRHDGRYRV